MSYRMSRSPGMGCPWGLYQQQGMPARLPPAMSLVRESPMRRISSRAQGPMAWSTGWKKSRLGFSAPRVSEMNTPSSHAPRPDRASFFSCTRWEPLVTAYCFTWECRSRSSWSLWSRKTTVSPK